MAQAPQQNFDASLMKVASMLPTIPNDDEGRARLAQLVTHPQFGALALTEISRRDRADTLRKAQEGAGGGNIADAMVAKMMADQMQERLAADERFGLNNIVSQAEQGAIDFGGQEPEMQAEPMSMAGGGMIAFERGGKVPGPVQYDDGSQGYLVGALVQGAARLAPYAGRAVGRLKSRGIGTTGAGILALPAGFLGGGEEEIPEGPPVSDTYPEEFERGSAKDAAKVADLAEAAQGAKNEKEAARGIADLLGGKTTASDILKERRRLEEEAGLGEYGAGVKEKQAKRRAETEEKFGKEKQVQALTSAAKALGGKRIEGGIAGVLGAAATGGAEGALGVMREERAALEKLDESQEKMAMAEDLYRRGDIASAQKMAAEAQQQQQANALKLRQIQSTEAYQGLMAQAAIARASQTTGVKPGDAINAIKESNNLRQRMAMLDPSNPAEAAEIQAIQQQLQMLKLLAGTGTMRGAGISIQDVPDEA
jgi:hypothetical protein